MKIGINAWTFPSNTSPADGFALAKRAGFDVVEINLAEEGELALQSTVADAKGILQKAQDAGVELRSVSTGLHWRYPLSSPESETRQKGIDIVRKQIELAQALGADTVLVVPGTVTPEVSYEAAYDRAGNALRELASEAQSAQVAIGVENVWNKFLLSPIEFARFVDECENEWVGAYFDIGNILAYGFPDQWIRTLGKRIKKVHAKDFKSGIGNIRAFCNPLQGDVPWQKVRAALDEIGYDDAVTAEVEGYKVEQELGLKHIADSLRAVFGGE